MMNRQFVHVPAAVIIMKLSSDKLFFHLLEVLFNSAHTPRDQKCYDAKKINLFHVEEVIQRNNVNKNECCMQTFSQC